MPNALTRWLSSAATFSASSFAPLGYGPGGNFGVERKAAVSAPISAQPFNVHSIFLNPAEIVPFLAWQFYLNSETLSMCVDLIADKVAGLVPMVKIDGELVDGHPVMQFLARPGFNRTRQRFIKELAIQYLVAGTAYPLVIGNISQPPIALDIVKSQFVSIFPGSDMWPDTYSYSEGTRTIRFSRDGVTRDPRWIDTQSQLSELVPIYDMDGNHRGVGLSRLNSIKADVELRLRGIAHNTAVLENGARMSGVLAFKEQLNVEQRDDIQGMIDSRTRGSNKGGVLVTDGGQAEFTAMSQSAKDMDFANLVKLVEDAIVRRYGVPVTLFRVEAQTNNNYETAWSMFYDNAVLPVFETIYAGLAHIFSERLGQNIEIVHDALTNNVLANQASNRAIKLFGSHIISRNEARNIAGYEPVLGGDTIYGALGETPVAEDYFFTDGRNDPYQTNRDAHGHADGFQDLRRQRNPDQVPPGEGEQHEIQQDNREQDRQDRLDAQQAQQKPAGKPPKQKRLALIYNGAGSVPKPMRVKQYEAV
jgi:HK97 family phage portal protein